MFKKKSKTVVNDESNNLISLELQSAKEKHVKNESCNMKTVAGVNELLQFMTTLDYVKEMIRDANHQSEMVENVAASSEQMSSATEDISNFVQDSNKTMNDVMEKTSTSLKNIEATFNEIESNINETNSVKAIMHEVIEETKRINEMVNVIKSVADQTNLLSLNASIEAARAGEHGRGFAVVADEVKKLAESTTQQVDLIQDIVNTLNVKINKASSEIDRVVNTFGQSKEAIDKATGGIKEINGDLEGVADSFSEISANVEEQTASTQEMSSNLMIITENASKLMKESNRTGQAFFEISQKIDEIRIRSLGVCENIDNEVMIELSITDHLMWKWRVYNMILGYIKLDTSNVGNHHECRLGKWLESLDKNNSSISEIIEIIEEPHSNIHATARDAIAEYEKGNIANAEKLLKDIEVNSDFVVKELKNLKKYI